MLRRLSRSRGTLGVGDLRDAGVSNRWQSPAKRLRTVEGATEEGGLTIDECVENVLAVFFDQVILQAVSLKSIG